MKNKSLQTTNKILMCALWIILVMSLYFVYTWIAFNNTIIDDYLAFRKLPHEATKVLFNDKFPTEFKIRYINILSAIILVIALFLLLSLIFVNKYNEYIGQKLSNIFKFSILIVAPVLLIISIALFNYSAYNYWYVNEWVEKVSNIYKGWNSGLNIDKFYDQIPPKYQPILFAFLKTVDNKVNDNKGYNWVNLSSSWWLVELQILVIVLSAFRLNFIVNFDKEDNFKLKKIKLLQLKKTTGDPLSKRLISSLTAPSEKNVILWFIFISIILFLPQFAYVFYINSNYSIARELVSFSYEIPNMIIPVGSELLRKAMSSVPSTITYVYYAPLVSMCLMSAIIVGFIYFFLNSKTLSFSTTVYLICIYVLVAVSSLAIIMNSQIQFEKLVNLWNSQDGYFKVTVSSVIFQSVFNGDISNQIPNIWLTGHELVSSIILSYSFLVVLSFLSLMQMLKVRKQINLKNYAFNRNKV